MLEKSGYYNSSEVDKSTKEVLSDGRYKYIFYGKDGTVIISSLNVDMEHIDLATRPFNAETDDAGRFSLRWVMSPEEIARQVEMFSKLSDSKKQNFDPDQYRAQLEANHSSTSIDIDATYGSDTLSYEPNPITRSQFINRLAQLFPSANIFQRA